jgi:hypothetical protein
LSLIDKKISKARNESVSFSVKKASDLRHSLNKKKSSKERKSEKDSSSLSKREPKNNSIFPPIAIDVRP